MNNSVPLEIARNLIIDLKNYENQPDQNIDWTQDDLKRAYRIFEYIKLNEQGIFNLDNKWVLEILSNKNINAFKKIMKVFGSSAFDKIYKLSQTLDSNIQLKEKWMTPEKEKKSIKLAPIPNIDYLFDEIKLMKPIDINEIKPKRGRPKKIIKLAPMTKIDKEYNQIIEDIKKYKPIDINEIKPKRGRPKKNIKLAPIQNIDDLIKEVAKYKPIDIKKVKPNEHNIFDLALKKINQYREEKKLEKDLRKLEKREKFEQKNKLDVDDPFEIAFQEIEKKKKMMKKKPIKLKRIPDTNELEKEVAKYKPIDIQKVRAKKKILDVKPETKNDIQNNLNELKEYIKEKDIMNFWVESKNLKTLYRFDKTQMRAFLKENKQFKNKLMCHVKLLFNDHNIGKSNKPIFIIKIYVYKVNNDGEIDYDDSNTWSLVIQYDDKDLELNPISMGELESMIKNVANRKIMSDMSGISYDSYNQAYYNTLS